ncbi:hypothetical protein DFA_07582 [Cavenderia fasciculata]|uniref:Uncharacterized protein n=1 Tax=Cavenderia fasciculata TaxID=261658 RepID=F4PWU4_CACFS|nr:uncharacterized protein DFA_07582 [Cavenderia fasciculata]EGG20458.1 hypothetical protein DFA_07582 [Cavenderia fasciculata]|eukprot:XP_004367441.1 hypothetical protein DFA_07582 [Cavenderia fasciculata]
MDVGHPDSIESTAIAVEQDNNENRIYTENELKSKLKKDLLVICQPLEIRSMTSQTKIQSSIES